MLLWATLLAASAGAADAPVRLDAGPASSAVLDGFSRLDPTGSDDPRVRWTSPPTLVRELKQPDPLVADALGGGALHLDLPPGVWLLAAILGDPAPYTDAWATPRAGLRVDGADVIVRTLPDTLPAFLATSAFAANPRPVFRAGETAFDRQVVPRTAWQRVAVTVGDHGVDVAAFGTPLRALVVAPAGFDLDTELALVDARRARWWSERVHPAADALPPLRPGPLTVTPAALGDRDPTPDGPVPDVVLGRGDRATRLLWIGGGDGPGVASVDAPAGIEARLSEVSWLDETVHPADPLRPRPTVAWAGGAWKGGQGVPPALALEVRTAVDAAPGRRVVRVTLRRGDEAVTLRVPVVVHGVDVERRLHAGLFTEVPHAPRQRLGLHAPETLASLDAQLDVMADLGLDVTSLRNATPIVTDPTDTAVLAHAATRWRALGGVGILWTDPLAQLRRTGEAVSDDVLRAMLRATATADVPVWVGLFEEDDWRQEGALALGRARLERVGRLDPDAARLIIPSTPLGWSLAEQADVALVGGEGALLAAGVAAVRARGAAAFTYNLPPGASEPLLAWAAGAEGVLAWHADMSPYDPFDMVTTVDQRSHLLLGPDGVFHPTVALLDLADGLADARLLATLSAHVDALPPDAHVAAERLLAATRSSLLGAVPLPGADGVLLAPDARAAVRARALALLDRLPRRAPAHASREGGRKPASEAEAPSPSP